MEKMRKVKPIKIYQPPVFAKQPQATSKKFPATTTGDKFQK
jgi:hypothetical protein